MFEVVHEVPGRLRLHATALRGNAALADRVLADLRTAPGVRAASANLRTGSVLIRHDAAPGRAAWLRHRLSAAPPSAPTRDGTAVRVVDAVLEHVAAKLLGAVAVALI